MITEVGNHLLHLGVGKPLKFAAAVLGRTVRHLDTLTDEEKLHLLCAARHQRDAKRISTSEAHDLHRLLAAFTRQHLVKSVGVKVWPDHYQLAYELLGLDRPIKSLTELTVAEHDALKVLLTSHIEWEVS